MGGLGSGQREYLEDKFGSRVSFQRTERKLYGHDIAAVPGMVKPLVGDTVPDAVVQPENEEELVDRAKIALMRIEPELLKGIANGRVREATLMHFEVYDKKSKKVSFSLTIPFVFGRLALESIPGDAKSKLKREGYDLDRLVVKLIEKRELVKIEDEDSRVKIWVE